jgi:hypothetical protein
MAREGEANRAEHRLQQHASVLWQQRIRQHPGECGATVAKAMAAVKQNFHMFVNGLFLLYFGQLGR